MESPYSFEVILILEAFLTRLAIVLPPVVLFIHVLNCTGMIAVPNIACLAFIFWTIVACNVLVLNELTRREVNIAAMVAFPDMTLVTLVL
jgi:hypothetical protein